MYIDKGHTLLFSKKEIRVVIKLACVEIQELPISRTSNPAIIESFPPITCKRQNRVTAPIWPHEPSRETDSPNAPFHKSPYRAHLSPSNQHKRNHANGPPITKNPRPISQPSPAPVLRS